MRRLGAWLFLASAGCGPEYPIILAPTEAGVDRAAILLYDADGKFLEGTGLGAVSASSPLKVVIPTDVPATSAIMVGYRGIDLIGAPDSARMAEDRVRPAGTIDPRLPKPTISARLDFDGQEPELIDTPLPLTVDWLEPCRPLTDVSLVLSCAIQSCDPQIVQTGCLVQIDPPDNCTTDPPELRLDGNGAVVEAAGQMSGECAAVDPALGAIATVECARNTSDGVRKVCQIDLVPDAQPARFATHSFVLFPGATNGDGFTFTLADVVTVGDRAVIASHDGRAQSWSCSSTLPDRFDWVDPVAGASVRNAPAPPCTSHLMPDPDGFLAIHGAGPTTLGFFDADGVEQRTIPVPELLHVAHASRVGETVYYGGTREDVTEESWYEVWSLDLATGTATQVFGMFQDMTGLATTESGVVVAVDDDGDTAHVKEPRDEAFRMSLGSGAAGVRALNGVVYHHPMSNLFIIAARADLAGLTVFEPHLIRGRAVTFGNNYNAQVMIAWPRDPQLMIVQTSLVTTGTQYVTLADPAVPRYIPGMVEIEMTTPARRATIVGDRVVLPAAHSAEVTIVSPLD